MIENCSEISATHAFFSRRGRYIKEPNIDTFSRGDMGHVPDYAASATKIV
jgi:hypothetical protein